MPTFEPMPTYVEAYRWMVNGDHPNDSSVDGSDGKVVRRFRSSDRRFCRDCGITSNLHGWINTPMSGGYKVCPGDWIIADEVMGWKPMSPKMFDTLYQMVRL